MPLGIVFLKQYQNEMQNNEQERSFDLYRIVVKQLIYKDNTIIYLFDFSLFYSYFDE